MKYTGIYVNLDRSLQRRLDIEGELERAGLAGYRRFAACDGNPFGFPNRVLKIGEMGCFSSHYRLLVENAGSGLPLHVIEDDIVLSSQTGQVLDWVIESGQLDKFDLVFTDVAVPLLNDACHAYKAYYDATVKRGKDGKIESVVFSVVDMRELIFGSTCSFLVNPGSIGKLAALYEGALRAGAVLPVDLFIRKLCQDRAINVGCVFPFVTSPRLDMIIDTTIENRFDALSAYAPNLLRHSFFVGCDWKVCLNSAVAMFPQPALDDDHRQLMQRLIGYSLTAGYKKI